MLWMSSSIPSLRPEPASKRSKCNNASHCLPAFCRSEFQIMLHPKIAGIRVQLLLSRDLRGLVHGMPHLPEMKWFLEKSMSQCEINCLVKVGFKWNNQSDFQVCDVEFPRLRFVSSLGWQKSTAQKLTCGMMLTHDSQPPPLLDKSWHHQVSERSIHCT